MKPDGFYDDEEPQTRNNYAIVAIGDNRTRQVCADCGFINYENPKIVVAVFVEFGLHGYVAARLATKIIEIGHGEAVVYPGTYSEFLWSKEHAAEIPKPKAQTPNAKPQTLSSAFASF